MFGFLFINLVLMIPVRTIIISKYIPDRSSPNFESWYNYGCINVKLVFPSREVAIATIFVGFMILSTELIIVTPAASGVAMRANVWLCHASGCNIWSSMLKLYEVVNMRRVLARYYNGNGRDHVHKLCRRYQRGNGDTQHRAGIQYRV